MTILKISNYYLSFPQKKQGAKEFFERALEDYVLETLDQDADFDLDLFIEDLDFNNDVLEILEGQNIKDEEIYFEYSEEGLEDLIQKFFDSVSKKEDDDVEYYKDCEDEDEDY